MLFTHVTSLMGGGGVLLCFLAFTLTRYTQNPDSDAHQAPPASMQITILGSLQPQPLFLPSPLQLLKWEKNTSILGSQQQ